MSEQDFLKSFPTGSYVRERSGECRIGRIVEWDGPKVEIRWSGGTITRYLADPFLMSVQAVPKEAVGSPMADPTVHLAMKWHFNDAGHRGICSWPTIEQNRLNKQSWCSKSGCWEYQKKGSKRPLLQLPGDGDWPCDEAKLFSEFGCSTGGAWLAMQKHKTAGKDLTIPEERQKLLRNRGKLAFMTTREFDSIERDRYIFGLFEIAEIENFKDGDFWTTWIQAKVETSFHFDPGVRLKFWDVYRNSKPGEQWGQGLYRYLSGGQAKTLLEQAIKGYKKLAIEGTRRKHVAILEGHLSRLTSGGAKMPTSS